MVRISQPQKLSLWEEAYLQKESLLRIRSLCCGCRGVSINTDYPVQCSAALTRLPQGQGGFLGLLKAVLGAVRCVFQLHLI